VTSDHTADPDRVLFLKYEGIMSEPVKYVIRLARFLGVPFSTKEEEDGIPEEVVRVCSFDKLSSLHANQTGGIFGAGNIKIDKSVFFRKGKVGDWVNHMSQEMGRKLDCVMEEKLKGSGLVALICIFFGF
jgi:estrone sulfotransferase